MAKILVVLVVLLPLSVSVAAPVHEVVLESVTNTLNDTLLVAGNSHTVMIRFRNLDTPDYFLPSNGFRVFSEDGAMWNTTDGEYLNGFEELFEYDFIGCFSCDGQGGDTIGFGAAWLEPDQGMPPGWDEVSIGINIGPTMAADHGKSICIDSSYKPPGGFWMWANNSGGLDLAPDWSGQKCFTVLDCDNPDNNLEIKRLCGGCVGIAGNVDCDSAQLVDIGDLTRLIDFMFLSHEPLSCPGEANVDGDPDGLVDIGDVTRLIDFLFISHAPLGECEPGGGPTGSVIDHSGCKSVPTPPVDPAVDTTSDLDCLEWSYDGSSTLSINHVNAGFNCCPIIAADIRFEDNTIIIEELDSLDNGGCHCLCLFDVEYEISNLPPGQYRMIVIEPYRWEGDPELDFLIDLSSAGSGIHCESRSQYPWGQQ